MKQRGYEYQCAGYEAITISDTAIGFTAAKIAPTSGQFAGFDCKAVLLTVETDDIRYTLDGETTPTDAIGHLIDKDIFAQMPFIIIEGVTNVKNFSAIRVTTDASLKVSYLF